MQPTIKCGFLYSFVNSDKQKFNFRNFESRRSLARKVRIFHSLHFSIFHFIQTEKDVNYINTRIKLQSLRALKRCLNDENLAHRKTATTTIETFMNRIKSRTIELVGLNLGSDWSVAVV